MTYEEALDEMEFGIEENEFTGFYTVKTEAYEKAIEAIEMQIAKKPRIERDNVSSIMICFCPICDYYVCGVENGEHAKHIGKNYCPRCGQAIDWSNEK